MEQSLTNPSVDKMTTLSPDKQTGLISSPLPTIAVAQSIFTKAEKNNAFGEKVYERTSSVLFNYDVTIIQQVSNKILELGEQAIVSLLVDQLKFKSIVEKYKVEVEKHICDLNNREKSESSIKDNQSRAETSPIVQEKCAICLDVLGNNNKSVTPCGHHFCFTCLYQAMDKQNNCPLCRAKLIENKKRKMRKLSNEAMADIITETMSDFNLRRHIRSAELFSNNRNNMDSDDIICSSVQIYSLQLTNNIQRQQLSKNYYYDDDDSEEEEEEEEEEEDEEEEEEV